MCSSVRMRVLTREPHPKLVPWRPEESIVDSGSPVAARQIRCTIKKGSALKPLPYSRVGNLGPANQAAPADG